MHEISNIFQAYRSLVSDLIVTVIASSTLVSLQ